MGAPRRCGGGYPHKKTHAHGAGFAGTLAIRLGVKRYRIMAKVRYQIIVALRWRVAIVYRFAIYFATSKSHIAFYHVGR